MRRTMLLGVLLAMGVVGIVAGQAPQQPNVAEIEKVRDNLFMIKGGGGNTAAFITANRGVILVDTKDPGWGPAIMDKVRSVTDKPVMWHHQYAYPCRPRRQQRLLRADRSVSRTRTPRRACRR